VDKKTDGGLSLGIWMNYIKLSY